MKQTRAFFFKKPRPKGWKRSIQTVSYTERRERARQAAPMPRGEGYLTGPCVVLLAAVFGTRAAFYWAMEHLPTARRADARRFQ